MSVASWPPARAWRPRSSGHQDREARLVQNGPRDATKHPLSHVGVPIGAHHEQIGAESGGLRQQQATHVLSARRHASYLYMRAVTRQVARDVLPRFLTVALRAALMVDDQDLDRVGLDRKSTRLNSSHQIISYA